RADARSTDSTQSLRLQVVVCKKWHVGKRILTALTETTGQPNFGYLFQEENAGLPDLGGLEEGLARRTRNVPAFLNVLAEVAGGPLTFCLDPQETEILAALKAHGADVRVLEVTCDYTNGYLLGHAERMGLPMASLDEAARGDLLGALRANIEDEHRALTGLGLRTHARVEEYDPPQKVSEHLRELFELEPEAAYRAAHNARFNQPGSSHVRL
ncbi:MAG: DUF5928 domain-containing protein, partial [Pseudomonadota bacterium]